jgi:hypothetical protein
MKERGGCSERVVISSQSRKSSKKEQATAPTKHHDEGHQHEFSFDSSNHTHTQKRKNPLVIPNTMQMIKKKNTAPCKRGDNKQKGESTGRPHPHGTSHHIQRAPHSRKTKERKRNFRCGVKKKAKKKAEFQHVDVHK